jgi:hypothetical protein
MVEIVSIYPPESDSNTVHFGGAVSAQDGVTRLLTRTAKGSRRDCQILATLSRRELETD